MVKKCIQCVHHVQAHPIAPVQNFCKHPQNTDMVMAISPCYVERSDKGFCGPSAFGFQLAYPAPPAPPPCRVVRDGPCFSWLWGWRRK